MTKPKKYRPKGPPKGTKGTFPCPECERVFEYAAAVGRHRLSAHGVAGTKGHSKKKHPNASQSDAPPLPNDPEPPSNEARETPAEASPQASEASGPDTVAPTGPLTFTDEQIAPLRAPPDERPAAPSSRTSPEKGATANPRTIGESHTAPSNGDAQDDTPSPVATAGGAAGAFQKRDAPALGAWTSVGESLKKNWIVIAIILALIIGLLAWRMMKSKEPERRPKSKPEPETVEPQLRYRPSFNPEVHGSLENFRERYGHLPLRDERRY